MWYFTQDGDNDLRDPFSLGSNWRVRNDAGSSGREVELSDGVMRYDITTSNAKPDLLWLLMTHDSSSWGKSSSGHARSVDDLHDIIASQYDPAKVSLGLLTSSEEEYELYKRHVENSAYSRVTVFLHPGFQDGPPVDRKHRHLRSKQYQRRSEMAKLRNFLMLKTLQEEQHMLWLDADVWHLDDGIVRRMLRHSKDNKDAGILTARCQRGNKAHSNYDLNAWRGTRKGPRGWDLTEAEIEDGELEQQGQFHVSDLIEDTESDDLMPLDAIGATLLYMRSTLILQGLSFPHQYTVGTRWGKDGWDGIESEGICYRARGMKGGKCMVLGGKWHVSHE